MRQSDKPLSLNYHARHDRQRRDWKRAKDAGVPFVCRFCRRALAQRGFVRVKRPGATGRPAEWITCTACHSVIVGFLEQMEATTPHRADWPPEDLRRKEL